MNFKSSFYNYMFQKNSNFYVYNILTTAIAEINEDIYEKLINNKISDISQEYRNELFAEGFIVQDTNDEKNYYKHFYESSRYGSSAKVLGITIIPTYNCNLRCPYCYEGSKKNRDKISKTDVDKILQFISKKIVQSNKFVRISKLRIMFFGGEPLMCKNELLYFCNSVSNLVQKYKIEIEYSMVTNLTILDTEIINMIKNHKIVTQVSIDGIKAEHNKRRIYADGTGTYDIIIKNIKELVDKGLKHLITIRINIDEKNSECAEDIFTDLKEYSDDIYFGILKTYKGYNDNYNQKCFQGDCIDNISITKLHDIYSYNGFEVPQKFGKKSPCSMNAQNKFIIDNKLDVYKCELLVNHPECRIGYIDNNGNLVKEPNFYQQMSFSPFLFKECNECKLLPLCGAGCPAEIYLAKQLKNGDIIHKNCTYTEESLKNYLLDYIKRL